MDDTFQHQIFFVANSNHGYHLVVLVVLINSLVPSVHKKVHTYLNKPAAERTLYDLLCMTF